MAETESWGQFATRQWNRISHGVGINKEPAPTVGGDGTYKTSDGATLTARPNPGMWAIIAAVAAAIGGLFAVGGPAAAFSGSFTTSATSALTMGVMAIAAAIGGYFLGDSRAPDPEYQERRNGRVQANGRTGDGKYETRTFQMQIDGVEKHVRVYIPGKKGEQYKEGKLQVRHIHIAASEADLKDETKRRDIDVPEGQRDFPDIMHGKNLTAAELTAIAAKIALFPPTISLPKDTVIKKEANEVVPRDAAGTEAKATRVIRLNIMGQERNVKLFGKVSDDEFTPEHFIVAEQDGTFKKPPEPANSQHLTVEVKKALGKTTALTAQEGERVAAYLGRFIGKQHLTPFTPPAPTTPVLGAAPLTIPGMPGEKTTALQNQIGDKAKEIASAINNSLITPAERAKMEASKKTLEDTLANIARPGIRYGKEKHAEYAKLPDFNKLTAEGLNSAAPKAYFEALEQKRQAVENGVSSILSDPNLPLKASLEFLDQFVKAAREKGLQGTPSEKEWGDYSAAQRTEWATRNYPLMIQYIAAAGIQTAAQTPGNPTLNFGRDTQTLEIPFIGEFDVRTISTRSNVIDITDKNPIHRINVITGFTQALIRNPEAACHITRVRALEDWDGEKFKTEYATPIIAPRPAGDPVRNIDLVAALGESALRTIDEIEALPDKSDVLKRQIKELRECYTYLANPKDKNPSLPCLPNLLREMHHHVRVCEEALKSKAVTTPAFAYHDAVIDHNAELARLEKVLLARFNAGLEIKAEKLEGSNDYVLHVTDRRDKTPGAEPKHYTLRGTFKDGTHDFNVTRVASKKMTAAEVAEEKNLIAIASSDAILLGSENVKDDVLSKLDKILISAGLAVKVEIGNGASVFEGKDYDPASVLVARKKKAENPTITQKQLEDDGTLKEVPVHAVYVEINGKTRVARWYGDVNNEVSFLISQNEQGKPLDYTKSKKVKLSPEINQILSQKNPLTPEQAKTLAEWVQSQTTPNMIVASEVKTEREFDLTARPRLQENPRDAAKRVGLVDCDPTDSVVANVAHKYGNGIGTRGADVAGA